MPVLKVDIKKLQTVKKARGYSSYKIAAIDGTIRPETVQKIVAGTNGPTAVNLKRICDVLEIPIQDVFIEAAA